MPTLSVADQQLHPSPHAGPLEHRTGRRAGRALAHDLRFSPSTACGSGRNEELRSIFKSMLIVLRIQPRFPRRLKPREARLPAFPSGSAPAAVPAAGRTAVGSGRGRQAVPGSSSRGPVAAADLVSGSGAPRGAAAARQVSTAPGAGHRLPRQLRAVPAERLPAGLPSADGRGVPCRSGS